MPLNDMTVRWIRYFGTAGAQHSNGRKFDSQIPQGYHVPHCVGNPTGEFLTPQSEQISQRPEELRLCH